MLTLGCILREALLSNDNLGLIYKCLRPERSRGKVRRAEEFVLVLRAGFARRFA